VANDPNALARFLHEGEALRQLNHPNIVSIIDVIEEKGDTHGVATASVEAAHYLVMEYVPGGSLRDLLDQEGTLPIARAVGIALEVADALTRAH
jgi:serine/threonine-protein kinase